MSSVLVYICGCRVAPHLCYLLQGSDVEVLVAGVHCPPVSEVHVDIGGYKIIHLVTLLKENANGKQRKWNKKHFRLQRVCLV